MDLLRTDDGLLLHLRRWPARPTGPDGRVHGTVQIVHGLGEHIGRYESLAGVLSAAGWHVGGHDQRGHGRSEGERGAIPGLHALLADLGAVTDHLRSPGRHVRLGHSMGGLIAARFVAETLMNETRRWSREVHGLVLSSPALEPGVGRLRRAAVRLLSNLTPNLSLDNGLKPTWLSRNPDTVSRYIADPLVHDRITPRLARFILEEGPIVQLRAPRWRTPTLLLWGGADRCVSPRGSEAFAAAAPPQALTARGWREAFHEILNEPAPDGPAALGELGNWLERFHAA